MENTNSSWFQPTTLLLIGILGLEDVQIWFSIPLCVMYLIALLGNCTILFVIKTTPILHEPQYIFLSMLAATDMGLSVSTLPTVLNVFLLDHRAIKFHSCLTQMFFIHTFSSMESAILLAMAFDCFFAISNPLHYTVVLTSPWIIRMGLAAVVRGVMLMIPLPILLKRLPFCKGVILSHCYCYHPDIMQLACGPVRVNIIYGLFADDMIVYMSDPINSRSSLALLSRVLCDSRRCPGEEAQRRGGQRRVAIQEVEEHGVVCPLPEGGRGRI
ncbi:olfactory receptor 51G2-like [Microtus pennsylvanicus]|uniref:olfactory receptor 51G2-like n=1 Tax=Microtus pennsylvanicus TaxID=10058 RepID=UPI003F6C3B10